MLDSRLLSKRIYIYIITPLLSSVVADFYLTGGTAWEAAILLKYESAIKDVTIIIIITHTYVLTQIQIIQPQLFIG